MDIKLNLCSFVIAPRSPTLTQASWAFKAERIGPHLILYAQIRTIWYHVADAGNTIWPTLRTWSTMLCHTELQYSPHGLTVIS